MTLRLAVHEWLQQSGSSRNSYEWYCRSARSCQFVSFGEVKIRACKIGRNWCIEEPELLEAIRLHHLHLAQIKQNTDDYIQGIVRGKDGDVIRIEGGGYEIHGQFRFAWNDQDRYLRKSDGHWYCNGCNIGAETVHDREECHRCRDWNSCGTDCTLSEIYCKQCGAKLAFA